MATDPVENKTATRISIGGFDIPLTMPFEIRFTRGVAPYRMRVPIDPLQADEIRANMPPRPEITISTANTTFKRTDTVSILGWYFLRLAKAKGGHYYAEMADPRFGLNFQKLTAAYNQRGFFGAYKFGTDSSGGPWSVGEFLQDAFSRIAQPLTFDPALRQDLLDAPFPDNFGDETTGSLFASPASEWLPQILEPMRADLTIDTSGGFVIVERSSNTLINRLVKPDGTEAATDVAILNDDTVLDVEERGWQKPSLVRILFRKRVERALQFRGFGFTQVSGRDLTLRNVAVEYALDANGVPVISEEFKDINTVVINKLRQNFSVGQADELLRERILRPALISYQGEDVLVQREKTAQMAILKAAYRRWFQINGVRSTDTAANRRVFSKLANIQFGRIQENGEVKGPAVFGTWVARRKYGIVPKGSYHVLDQRFAENHEHPAPAPFDVEWLDEKQAVLQLKPNSDSVFIEDAYIGNLRKLPQFGTVQEMFAGLPIGFTNYGEFNNREKIDVYFVADVIQDYGDLPSDDGGSAEYVIELSPNYPTAAGTVGQGLTGQFAIEYRVDELTANYQWDGGETTKWGTGLMNLPALEAKADEILAGLLQQFEGTRSGVVKFGGVEALNYVDRAGGSIYELVVKVGDKMPFGVTIEAAVLPDVRKAVTPKERVPKRPLPTDIKFIRQ